MTRLAGPAVKQAQRFAHAPVEIPNVVDDHESADARGSVAPDHPTDREGEGGQ